MKNDPAFPLNSGTKPAENSRGLTKKQYIAVAVFPEVFRYAIDVSEGEDVDLQIVVANCYRTADMFLEQQ